MAIRSVSIALSRARSVKFYVEQLGFTCPLQLGGFARVRLGAADIMLGATQCPSAMARPALYRLDLSDELWESLKTRARVAYPIETMEYGVREFGLLDDNGYQLSFAQHVSAN